MSWGVGARHLPRVNTYAEAVKLESTIVPIRGSGTNAGKKPMGDRRFPEVEILKGKDDTIAVRVYTRANPPLLTYHPNNTIHISGEDIWGVTTNSILYSILGLELHTHDNKDWLSELQLVPDGAKPNELLYPTGTQYHQRGTRYGAIPLPKHGMRVQYEYPFGFKALNFSFPTAHKINRKKMNEVRKQYKPFLDYFSGVLKLKEGQRLPDTVVTEHWEVYMQKRREDLVTLMRSSNAEDWWTAAECFLHSRGLNHCISYSAAMKSANDTLKHWHSDVVIEKKEVRTGAIFADPNRKFVHAC